MERLKRQAKLVRDLQSGKDAPGTGHEPPRVRKENGPESIKALREGTPPAPISLGTRSAFITFVAIMAAVIILLVVARVFLK
jgi:hypothetical protein